MPTETDTSRTLVLPKLYASGWTDNQIREEETFVACRSIIATRRADRVNKERAEFFAKFGPDARAVLGDLIEKYATDGELEFTLPDVLKVPPLSQRGNVNEIIGKFGGPDQLRNAVGELQTLLYAA
jgi:hypothetical protein